VAGLNRRIKESQSQNMRAERFGPDSENLQRLLEQHGCYQRHLRQGNAIVKSLSVFDLDESLARRMADWSNGLTTNDGRDAT
jgi:hypothetical protein